MFRNIFNANLFFNANRYFVSVYNKFIHFVVYFFVGFSLEERKRIYKNLAHCLGTELGADDGEERSIKLTIPAMYERLIKAEYITNNKSKAKRYETISKIARTSYSKTPNSDSLKKYIPYGEYLILCNAEQKSGLLSEALPYATITGEQETKLNKVNFMNLFNFASLFVVNYPVFYFMDDILGFTSPLLDRGNMDSYTKILLSISRGFVSSMPLVLFMIFSYFVFYFIMKDAKPTIFRNFLDRLPLFSKYRMRSASMVMINLSIEKSLSRGVPLSRIIQRMSQRYQPYLRGHINELSVFTAHHSFSDAISQSGLIPKDLKSSIVRSSILFTNERDIIKSSVEAVEKLIELREKVQKKTTVFYQVGMCTSLILIMLQNTLSITSMHIM